MFNTDIRTMHSEGRSIGLPRLKRSVFSVFPILIFISCCYGQVMRKEAQVAVIQPNHVDVRPLAKVARVGTELPVDVVLRDGYGNPVNASQDTEIELTVQTPQGQITKSRVTIAKGQNSKQTSVSVQDQGLAKLSVRQVNDQLLSGTTWIKIAPPAAQMTAKPLPHSKGTPKKKTTVTVNPTRYGQRYGKPVLLRTAVFNPHQSPELVFAAFTYQDNTVSRGATLDDSGKPFLMLRVSGENDAQGVRADGKSFARIQVFYMGSSNPAKDVRIWLSWSNGQIDNNPLIIKAGESVGEALWTSNSPIDNATVTVAATDPSRLRFQGERTAKVRFSEPILGIAFANPPKQISIVDAPELCARFFGPDGSPIQTSTKRPFRFTTNNPMIHLNPQDAEVQAGKADFSTVVFPTSLGSAVIEASIPGYQPVQLKLQVSGTSILILCVIGGLIGGWLGYVKSDGRLTARMAGGVILGFFATWAYVYIGLPNVNTIILHNEISALFVSFLAALGGVKIVAGISKALGFAF